MIDKEKLSAIRAEIEKAMAQEMVSYKIACEHGEESISQSPAVYTRLQMLLSFMDSMQKEHKFKAGDRIKPVDSVLGSPRTIQEVCDSWYVTDKGTLDFEFEDNWKVVEEPASEDLEEEIIRYIGYPQEVDEDVSTTMIRKAARHFAEWGRNHQEFVSEDLEDAATKYAQDKYLPVQTSRAFKDGAEWQRQQDSSKKEHTASDLKEICKSPC